jgi:pimeloyl-ACP methyl ester carboxylesterase
MEATRVAAPDGVALAVQEWGNPSGPEILLIHGFNQSHLSWLRQVNDGTLAAEFRMVTLDLRGHGSSDKPTDKERYAHQRWGDDIAAVMRAIALRRPVLVGWSFGGNVICDYVRSFGTKGIVGINFVAAGTKADPAFFGAGRQNYPGMYSDDLATNIASTRGFVRACFERQPEREDFETMLAFNMVVPAYVRTAVLGRPPNPGDALALIRCPVLVTHGINDRVLLVGLGKFTAAAVPGAKLSLYNGVGHAPFWEDAPRFNHELAQFVRAVNKTEA